ncbi:MAG: glycogen debranching enzyme, partial [Aeromonadaceae bacterium]
MKVRKGHCRVLGATLEGDGVNFAIWARLASGVELLLFRSADDVQPKVIRLSPLQNRTAYYWHVFVEDIGDGQLYGWRINGPWRPYEGTRFDPEK